MTTLMSTTRRTMSRHGYALVDLETTGLRLSCQTASSRWASSLWPPTARWPSRNEAGIARLRQRREVTERRLATTISPMPLSSSCERLVLTLLVTPRATP